MSVVDLPGGNYVEITTAPPSNPYAGGGYNVQLFSQGGDPIGEPLIQYSGYRTSFAGEPAITALPDGGAAVTFSITGYGTGVEVFRIEGDGDHYLLTQESGPPSGYGMTATVTPLADGGLVVAISHGPTSDVRQFDGGGQPVLDFPVAGWSVQVAPDQGSTYTLDWTSPAGPRSLAVDPSNPPDASPPADASVYGYDDAPGVVGDFASGAVINDPTPEIRVHVDAAGQIISRFGATEGYVATAADVARGYADVTSLAQGAGITDWQITSANGLGSARLGFSYTVDTSIWQPGIYRVFDNVGSSQGQLLDNYATDDSAPQVQVAVQGSNVGDSVELIVDGQMAASASVTANDEAAGYVSLTPALNVGAHTITAVATDPAGNVSAPSAPFHLTVAPEPGAVSIQGPSAVTEGDQGATPVTFTLTRAGSAAGLTQVDYYLWSTETTPADFTGPTAGTVTFADGESATTITVSVAGDLLAEADEHFTVSLSNVRGGTIAQGSAEVTIHDDDGGGGSAGGQTYTSDNAGDHWVGTSGDDTFNLGRGGDYVTGNGGGDTFRFAETPWAGGHITDFGAGDVLDLSGLLARSGYTGSDPIGADYIKITDDGSGDAQVWSDLHAPGNDGWWLVTTLDHVAASALQMQGGQVVMSGGSTPGQTYTSDNAGDHWAGTAGDDTFNLGRGGDVVAGGAGADTFAFPETPWAGAEIKDFSQSDGDRIDVSGLLARSGYTGSDPFADQYLKLTTASDGSAQLWSDIHAAGNDGWWLVATLDGVSAPSLHYAGGMIT